MVAWAHLFGGVRVIDGIEVLEVVGERDLVRLAEGGERLADKVGLSERVDEVAHHFAGALGVAVLEVVAGEEVAAVLVPVLVEQLLDARLLGGEDREPGEHGPQAVLLANVIRAGAEALLAAQRQLAGVHQVAEELPARRRLVALLAHRLGDQVERARRRHAARESLDALAHKVRYRLQVGGQHGHRVARRDEERILAQDHVAIAVAVERGAEVVLASLQQAHQALRIRQVRVGMQTFLRAYITYQITLDE